MPAKRETWYVYIVRCVDGSYYTGIAKNAQARIAQHNLGRGAAYTRSHRPVTEVYRQKMTSRVAALLREIDIKRLPRRMKEALIHRGRPFPKPEGRRRGVDQPWDKIFKRRRKSTRS